MDQVIELIAADWQRLVAFMPRVIVAVLVVIVFYLTGKYLAKIVTSILQRTSLRQIHATLVKTVSLSLTLYLGSIFALNILGLEKIAVSVLAGGGVTAIVLGFAFREIGENFLAGIFLAFSRPFRTGDAIKTEDIEGKVQDIELRYTHIRTDDGRDIYVPSSQLFSKPVTNFTKDGLRRINFSVGIDYANDAKAACMLLQSTVAGIAGVLKDPTPGAYILSLAPQYVEIQVYFWVDVFDKTTNVLAVRTDVMDKCRSILLQKAYTVSADTTTNIAIANSHSNGIDV